MKKSVLLLGLSVLLSSSLIACNGENNQSKSDKDVYLMQALTGLNIAAKKTTTSRLGRAFTDEDKNELTNILPTLDLMFVNDNNYSSVVNEINVVVNNINYQYEEIISYKNADDTNGSYRLIYNIDQTTTEEEEDEKEEESLISGLAYYTNDAYYPFYSKTESEIEEDENELERMFVINTSSTSSIVIKEEHETEENEISHELVYQIIENDNVKSFYKIEIENEDSVEEIEIKTMTNKYLVTRQEVDGVIYYDVALKGSDEVIRYKKEIDELGNISFVIVE